MQNIFDIPTVNDILPVEIDQEWVDKINSAFPFPYVTANEVDTPTLPINHVELEQARVRNLSLGRELRHDLIKRVPFLDETGAAQVVGGVSKLDQMREGGELIAVRDHGLWLYPRFQFNPKTHLPYPVIQRVETFFKKEINRWGEISWWVSKNIHLNERAPYEFLTPEREIELMLFLDENRLRLS